MQLAMLSKIGHKMSTDPEIGQLLKTAFEHPDYDSLDLVQKRNLYLIKKGYDEQTKLPEELVVEISKQKALTIDTWKKAKAAKDFGKFKPELKKLFDLKKQSAEILMDVKETATPYDAMLDVFEPKITTQDVTKVFNELRTGLISVLKKCESSSKQPDTSILERHVSVETQQQIGKLLAEWRDQDSQNSKKNTVDYKKRPEK